jgi:hypothetical protein
MDYILDSSGKCGVRFRGDAWLGDMTRVLINHEDFVCKAAENWAGKFLRVKGYSFAGSSRWGCGGRLANCSGLVCAAGWAVRTGTENFAHEDDVGAGEIRVGMLAVGELSAKFCIRGVTLSVVEVAAGQKSGIFRVGDTASECHFG